MNKKEGNDKTTCIDFTNNDAMESIHVETAHPANQPKHLVMTYTENTPCYDPNTDDGFYSLKLNMLCDKSESNYKVTNSKQNGQCTTEFDIRSKHGCPQLSATPLVEFLGKNPWILAILLIVLGLPSTFYGHKMIKYAVSIVGGGISFMILALAFSWAGLLEGLTDQGKSVWPAIGLLLLAIAVGMLVGFILFKIFFVGAIILAAVAGGFGGLLIYQLILSATESVWLLYALVILGGVAAGVFATYQFDNIMIFSTSLIGAYAFVRGISMFVGHFPNEIQLFNSLEEGVDIKLTNWFYIYFAAIVVLFVLGGFFQLREHKKCLSEKEGDFQAA